MPAKPVIFLAFANDRVDQAAYLRNLPKELHGIREALDRAVRADLCEVVERANATVADVLGIFQDERYRDRIAVFHYGGHANGYQLLLETADGLHASAHSGGLVPFLAKQRGLKLVFLNGCSSQQQALELVQAGVPSVIGTSQSINDTVATSLAVRFYHALGNGSRLERAWLEAIDQVNMETGAAAGNMRDLFWDGGEAEVVADRFPWEIYYRNGEELVRSWNLPDAVENPLFGLPDPAVAFDLPNEPYRFLQRYTREHAPLFFGRSYAIRDLFNHATDPKASPVVLFYGQSGVGKSSMLDAGLFPRLERTCQVVYARRNAKIGLLGTFQQALGLDAGGEASANMGTRGPLLALQEQREQLQWLRAQAHEAVGQALDQALQALDDQEADLKARLESAGEAIAQAQTAAEAWRAWEARAQQPLIVLLDQVEEAFTRANPAIKNELEAFLDEVASIFSDPTQRPQGKLILSYRKEYHPEIKEACMVRAIPKEEVFLKALTRKDIVEVVGGMARNERLRRKYRVTVEEELPVIIADDLLEDKDSPIAPVLQILLTKLWRNVEGDQERLFSVRGYQELKKQGILMQDFFYEQMALVAKKHPDMAASGLALDVLHVHITRLGTADSRTRGEVEARYADRSAQVGALLDTFKALYLLAETGANSTSLAHDTLAPLVVNEYRYSDKLGQRAAILLENKAIAFSQDPDSLLDLDDLKIVEKGASGMRLWTPAEEELVARSRERRTRVLAAQKRARYGAIAAAVVIVVVAIIAGFQAIRANKARLAAVQEQKIAESARNDAFQQRNRAEESRMKAEEAECLALEEKAKADTATMLAIRSAEEAETQRKMAVEAQLASEAAEQATKKALAQAETANKKTEAALGRVKEESEKAEQERRKAAYQLLLSTARQIAVKSTLLEDNDTLKAVLAVLAFEFQQQAHREFPTQKQRREDSHEIFEALERSVNRFYSDSLYRGESWSFALKNEYVLLSGQRGHILMGVLSGDERGRLPALQYSEDLQLPKSSKIYGMDIMSTTEAVLAMSNGEVLEVHTDRTMKPLYRHARGNAIAVVYDGKRDQIYSAGQDNTVKAWSRARGEVLWEVTLPHTVNALEVDEEKGWLLGADEGGRLLCWRLVAGQAPETEVLGQNDHPLRSLAYAPLRQLVVAGCSDGDLMALEMQRPGNLVYFTGQHYGSVTSLAFSKGERLLASSSYDGQILSWKLDRLSLPEMALQVPAVLQNGQQIFSIGFDPSGHHLLFSDREALKARTANPAMLYKQLQHLTQGQKLSDEQWEVYVGVGMARPGAAEGEEVP